MTSKVLNKETIGKAFSLLSERIENNGIESLHLIVCGGSALLALDLTSRDVTQDVDVLALQNKDGSKIASRPLPAEIIPIAESIARDLGLMPNWLNDGPSTFFDMGMPDGYETRLETESYGPCLTVSYLGRFDQIHFKLFATTTDLSSIHHYTDLEALKPTVDEMRAAAKWVKGRCPRKQALRDALVSLGHEHIANTI